MPLVLMSRGHEGLSWPRKRGSLCRPDSLRLCPHYLAHQGGGGAPAGVEEGRGKVPSELPLHPGLQSQSYLTGNPFLQYF